MNIIEILFIALSLAMDAFAISVCKGLTITKSKTKCAFIISLYFGVFQGMMPIAGYFLGCNFRNFIYSIDHWIAFILLSSIGINMIRDSLSPDDFSINNSLDFKSMIILSIATSIDALAIGITFSFLKVNIIFASFIIFLVTFILCFLGVKIGSKFGKKLKTKSELLGGFILIIIGLKILLDHLEILNL